MDILPRKTKRPVNVASAPKTTDKSRTVNPRPRPSVRETKENRGKKLIRYALVAVNLIVVGGVFYLVTNSDQQTIASYSIDNEKTVSSPLDALSSVDIAANIAEMTGMPEALAVTNQANTTALTMNSFVTEREFVTKSQILSPQIKSKDDIKEHKVEPNETLASLARQYGVTSDSIAWSNDIRRDLVPGTVIYIPPINGLVYQVGVSDTAQVLADRFSANAQEIIAFNDAEITGLIAGERIVIPNGVKPRTLSDILNFKASYGYNGYWYGYCTWYVANRVSMPNNWGDANTWDNYARVTPGWEVSNVPVPGAIAQSNRGPWGHVGLVEEVSEDGKMMKFSDMNGLAGWNRVGRSSDWISIDGGFGFENFIYKVN